MCLEFDTEFNGLTNWIPAFAGMTKREIAASGALRRARITGWAKGHPTVIVSYLFINPASEARFIGAAGCKSVRYPARSVGFPPSAEGL